MHARSILGLAIIASAALILDPAISQIREPTIQQRTLSLEAELRRLEITQAAMGKQHPKYKELQERIAQVKNQLQQLKSNPVADLTTRRDDNRALVEQMDDEELRVLVIRLATEMKLLQQRVAILEARVSPPMPTAR